VIVLPEERQAAERAADHLLPAGLAPERHELTVVRSVVLDDSHELDAGERQALRDGLESLLVAHAEHDGDRVVGEVPRRRIAGSVCDLGGEGAQRQVATSDDEVTGRGFGLLCSRRYVNRFSVGSS